MSNKFLENASTNIYAKYATEMRTIAMLQDLNKAVMLSSDSIQYIEKAYDDIKKNVKFQKTAKFVHYNVKPDVSLDISVLSDSLIEETEILNIITRVYNNNKPKYILTVDQGFECLHIDGEFNNDIKACLSRIDTMKKRLDAFEPVSKLPQVFSYFFVDCQAGEYYNEFFQPDGIIKSTVLEQNLRNLLLNYLLKKMKGNVWQELCTDYLNDEESVDLFVDDGSESAIIEVKFAFAKKYYAGRTNYSVKSIAKDGYTKLNKYAVHLAKDGRRTEYGRKCRFILTAEPL